MKIKQLFCSHIWKLEKEESLFYTKRFIIGYLRDITQTVANHYKCIKCEKTKILVQERMVAR